MSDLIKNLCTRPSFDFFGPEASEENLKCPIALDTSKDLLIIGCNEGIGRAAFIHEMAKHIVDSEIRPAWIKHNGSVILSELRKTVNMTQNVADKLLTKEGFVKLSDLHFFDREMLEGTSAAHILGSRPNPCPVDNDSTHPIKAATFSPALALRIQMGELFNPKACPDIFKEEPVVNKVNQYQKIEIKEPKTALSLVEKVSASRFDAWFFSRVVAAVAFSSLTVGLLYYQGYLPSFESLRNFMVLPRSLEA